MRTVTKTKPSVVILGRESYHDIFLTVFRFLTQKRINSQFFCAKRFAPIKFKRKKVQNKKTVRFLLG